MSCGDDPPSATLGADVAQTSLPGRARSPAESGRCSRTTSARQKGGYKMTAPGDESRTAPRIGEATPHVLWWKEPTRDQWYAYIAAWLGWRLDAFDFTVFLLIMAPIAQEFGVPLIYVTAMFSVTLVMRLG